MGNTIYEQNDISDAVFFFKIMTFRPIHVRKSISDNRKNWIDTTAQLPI